MDLVKLKTLAGLTVLHRGLLTAVTRLKVAWLYRLLRVQCRDGKNLGFLEKVLAFGFSTVFF